MLRNVKKLGKMWFSGSINDQFALKSLSTVAEIATLSSSFCIKWRKTRVTEHLYTYFYVFTMGSMLRNVKKLWRRWFSGSINYQFALKSLSTVAEIVTLSSSVCIKWRKTRVTEHLITYFYVFTMGSMLRNVKKLWRKWFSGSINDQFALKSLSTFAEIATLSSLFCFKWRKTRVTEHLNTCFYVFTMR